MSTQPIRPTEPVSSRISKIFRGPVILFVDDDEKYLETFKEILKQNGYYVETATSREEAMRKLEGTRYDMVITDLLLNQKVVGIDVIKKARLQKHTRTVILTAYPGRVPSEGSANNYEVIAKDEGHEIAVQRIHEILDKRRSTKRAGWLAVGVIAFSFAMVTLVARFSPATISAWSVTLGVAVGLGAGAFLIREGLTSERGNVSKVLFHAAGFLMVFETVWAFIGLVLRARR